MALEVFANSYATTLNGAITSTATSVVVTDSLPTGLTVASTQWRLLIESELVLVTAVSSKTLTITRGIEGTTASAHGNGASAAHVLTAGALNNTAAGVAPGTDGNVLTAASGLWSSLAPATHSNGDAIMSAIVTLTSTQQTISSLTLSLPAAGTYLIVGSTRALLTSSGTTAIIAQLYNVTTSANVGNPYFLATSLFGGGSQPTASISAVITVAAACSIALSAWWSGATPSNAQLYTDPNGGCILNWVRLA